LRDRRARVCVATDVAARGIDLPSLSLVVHVELPRDAEALQHRSGRTGRAGKKGVAVLIVPYQRRRRVEGMLRDARIQVEWIPMPTAAAIATADRARLLAVLAEPTEIDDEDRAIGADLLETREPLEIAAMLVRAHRAKLPAAEELLEGGTSTGPRERLEGPRDRQEGPRPGFEDTVWFRVNIGRRHNADPRWLLPLLCRRGHITKQDVGAIRIQQDETRFEIPRAAAGKFVASIKRTSADDADGEVRIEQADGPPQGGGGHRGPPRGAGGPGGSGGPRGPRGPNGPGGPRSGGARFQPRPTNRPQR
jgi:ATP-dependent RNA helicase DeaD